MSADNRLTPEELADLAPGDTVSIEIARDLRRTRHRVGTVVRVTATYVFVSSKGPGGGTYQERFGLRDGLRVGGLGHAELVHRDGQEPALGEVRRRSRSIDLLYHQWARDRRDVDTLRRLHAAIGSFLDGGVQGSCPRPPATPDVEEDLRARCGQSMP